MEEEPRSRWARWGWIAAFTAILLGVVAVVVAALASAGSTDSTLLAMSRLGAQGFGGGLIWGRYQPLSSPNATNPAQWKLPPGFVEQATNDLPGLVEVLKLDVTGGTPGSWRDRLPPMIRRWLAPDDNQARVGRSIAAFHALGSNAAPALPVLGEMLTNYPTSTAAAHALAGIGPESIPLFVQATGSSNEWIGFCGAWGLAQFGRLARPHAERVVQAQRAHPNSGGIGLMFWALGEIGGPPERILPTLATALQSTNEWIFAPAAAAVRRLNRIAELPDGHPDAWTGEEREWFAARRPALIDALRNTRSILGGRQATEAGMVLNELEASENEVRAKVGVAPANRPGTRPGTE